jgi:hypothetical protein
MVLASYDTRTDDTGIEIGLLLIASIVLAAVAPKRWWAIALLVGGFIPLVEMAINQLAPGRTPPGAVALVVTFIGALAGFGINRLSAALTAG